jgi:hypothetical protein
MMEIVFSVLHFLIRIETDCGELKRGLEDIKVRAKPDRLVSRHLDLKIHREDGRYIVWEGQEPVITCPDPKLTTVYLSLWINHRICGELTGLMIHGGCGTFQGKRFLLCGEKGTGKTTMLCRMLFEGVQIHCDETVFLDEDGAEPFPGKFHLKEGSIPLVLQLEPIRLRLSSYPVLSYGGGNFYFFDPSDAGFEWEVSKAKVDAFFYMEPERSESSQIVPCSKYLMVAKILGQTLNLEKDPRSQIHWLCKAVDAGVCHALQINDLEGGAEIIKGALKNLS